MGVVLVLLLGGSVLREALGIEWSAASVRETVKDSGPWAPALLIGMLAFRFLLLIPSQILLAAGGLLFGTLSGTLYGAIGLLCGGLVQFAIARGAGADAVSSMLPPRFDGALALARSRAGVGALAVLSGYPVGPTTAFHLGAALTGMSILPFIFAVAVGSFVRAGTYAFFGSSLVAGPRALIAVLVLCAVAGLPLLHPKTRGWLRQVFAGNR